jgi:hypothetical protein
MAAGTVAITYSESRPGVRSVIWTWTSDASGDVNGADTKALSGKALRFVTNPGATAPSDNYDIVVNDADGVDIAAGSLGNRDTATSEQAVPIVETVVGANTYGSREVAFDGPLSLVVTNAGNAKQGVMTMYYE